MVLLGHLLKISLNLAKFITTSLRPNPGNMGEQGESSPFMALIMIYPVKDFAYPDAPFLE